MPFIDLSDAGWDEFFPNTCSISSVSTTENDLGEPREVWAPLAGHSNLGAALEFKGGEIVPGGAVSTHTIHLRGPFPLVTAQMRATIGAQTFSILAAGCDSQSVKKRLLVEILK